MSAREGKVVKIFFKYKMIITVMTIEGSNNNIDVKLPPLGSISEPQKYAPRTIIRLFVTWAAMGYTIFFDHANM